jgi:hypothetical protein
MIPIHTYFHSTTNFLQIACNGVPKLFMNSDSPIDLALMHVCISNQSCNHIKPVPSSKQLHYSDVGKNRSFALFYPTLLVPARNTFLCFRNYCYGILYENKVSKMPCHYKSMNHDDLYNPYTFNILLTCFQSIHTDVFGKIKITEEAS